MCGRFTLRPDPRVLSATFEVPELPAALTPRYNVAPSQLVAVVANRKDKTGRALAMLRWGFVPRWATDPNSGPKPINAKVETVALKSPFRDSFRDRRCLIPADGFFEWSVERGKKQPHHFRLKAGGLFAFAGVWDVWAKNGSSPIHTCAIITVPANEVVKPLHERMPAVLMQEQFGEWLNPGAGEDELLSLLKPLPADLLEVVKVGPAVSKVANDGPECLSPAA